MQLKIYQQNEIDELFERGRKIFVLSDKAFDKKFIDVRKSQIISYTGSDFKGV